MGENRARPSRLVASDVQPAVVHDRRYLGHRVEQLLDAGPDLAGAGRRRGAGGRARGAGQVEQVRPFRFVEPQGPGQRVQHALGHAWRVASLKPGVVLDADAGQDGDLSAAQAGHPPVAAVVRQARLLRGDPGPPGA